MSDYEHMRSERGRANVLNHLGAAQVYVRTAIEYTKHTLQVMREGEGVHEVEQALASLLDADWWVNEAQGKNDEHVDKLSTST